MALLETRNVTKRFGGLQAVGQMDFILEQGQIVSIIGPNGAGKTTFFNTLTGIYRPKKVRSSSTATPLVGLRPDQITSLGMARTFQNIRLFGAMTVIENIMVGMYPRLKQSDGGRSIAHQEVSKEEKDAHDRAVRADDLRGLEGCRQ